jgi:hypothetical protein
VFFFAGASAINFFWRSSQVQLQHRAQWGLLSLSPLSLVLEDVKDFNQGCFPGSGRFIVGHSSVRDHLKQSNLPFGVGKVPQLACNCMRGFVCSVQAFSLCAHLCTWLGRARARSCHGPVHGLHR